MCKEKENYIFVSYAHKDSALVLPAIDFLKENGFDIWYDNGIEAGSEWPEYVAEKLLGCEVVLVFLSENAVSSHNCRREINFAIESKKELLIIYLEDLELSPGMRLQLGTIQAMFRSRFADNGQFYKGIESAKILSKCKRAAEASVTAQKSEKRDDILVEVAEKNYTKEEKSVQVKSAVKEETEQKIPDISYDTSRELVEKALIYIQDNGFSFYDLKFCKDLKDKQIKNFIKLFDDAFEKDGIVAAVDKTIMQNGKGGIVFTSDALCYTTGISDKKTNIHYYSQIQSARVKEGTVDELVVNFKDGTSITDMVRNENEICFFINIIAKNLKKNYEETDEDVGIASLVRKLNEKEEKNPKGHVFVFANQLKEKQIKNAIKAYAPDVKSDQVIAMMDTTIGKNGKEGFLLTEAALYSSEKAHINPIVFSALKDIRKRKNGSFFYLDFALEDGEKKGIFYSIYTDVIYSLLKEIIDNSK